MNVNITNLNREDRERMRVATQSVGDALNLSYVYIRAPDTARPGERLKTGGLTIAYVPPCASPWPARTVSVSLAWCNPKEPFSKLLGRYFAAHRYSDNERVGIRLVGNRSIAEQLTAIFQTQVDLT